MGQMKAWWDHSELVAKKLQSIYPGITKGDVYTYLLKDIMKAGLLETFLKGENLDKIITLDGWKRFTAKPEEQEEELDIAAQLKIASWYIKKIGSAERAKKVLDIAIRAIKDLES